MNSTDILLVGIDQYTCAAPSVRQGTPLLNFSMRRVECLPIWVWILVVVGGGNSYTHLHT